MDTFKVGNPDARVSGTAVTMMATLDVLQRAAAKGDNLVITHEPTFYNHFDRPEGLNASDAVWTAKRAFVEAHGIVVWRFQEECSRWLKTFITQVPIEFVPTQQPFWTLNEQRERQ